MPVPLSVPIFLFRFPLQSGLVWKLKVFVENFVQKKFTFMEVEF